MKSYSEPLIILFFFIVILNSKITAQPQIGTYPPQVHQQICQESTYTRYLDVFNTGKETLSWNAVFTPGPYDWVTAAPLTGTIEPGDTSQIAFYFNSSGLAIDNYYAYLQISSNDPVHPDTTVLAMLHVQDLTIFLEPENDSICAGCTTQLNVMAFGCSEEYQFSWTSDPPGFISTEKSPVVAPQVNTTYTVTVTDGGGSGQKSVFIQVYGSSSIEENKASPQVSIFPNPTDDQFILKLDSESRGKGMVTISDYSGRVVHWREIELEKGTGEYVITPGNLRPGIYMLSIARDLNTRGFFSSGIKLIVF